MAQFTLWLVGVGVLQTLAAFLGYLVANKSARTAHENAVVALAQKETNDRLLLATQESAKAAERALHMTERAQVGVPYTDWEVAFPEDRSMGDLRYEIRYNIANSGRTAATITDIQVFGGLEGSGPDSRPPAISFSDTPLPPEWEGKAVIGAGQVIPQTWTSLASDEELRSLWDGKSVYWIQGRVRYRDVFGIAHYTKFSSRLFLSPAGRGTFSFPLDEGYSDGD